MRGRDASPNFLLSLSLSEQPPPPRPPVSAMDFAHVELALALGEDMDEGFIKSYSIRPDSTSSLASASIVLLEGSSIGLALSDNGYQVGVRKACKIFETER